jgi:hypothetical protein
VTRDDIRLETPAGKDAITRFGMPDDDIMSGASRSAFSPPLNKTSVLTPSTSSKKGAKA